jgi:hypothetical protein
MRCDGANVRSAKVRCDGAESAGGIEVRVFALSTLAVHCRTSHLVPPDRSIYYLADPNTNPIERSIGL